MTPPFDSLTWLIALFGGLSILFLFPTFIVVRKKNRTQFWICFLSCILAAFISFSSFKKLESIHSELLDGSPKIKTKADLLVHYGKPSLTKFYIDDKGVFPTKNQKVECWIYEIYWLKPTILMQFEMVDDAIWARMAANNIK